jgi:hypothetical protein
MGVLIVTIALLVSGILCLRTGQDPQPSKQDAINSCEESPIDSTLRSIKLLGPFDDSAKR